MLANLLPGIREIRAPLASGYIWVISIWIGFFEYIPKGSEAQGIWKSLYQLSAVVGTAATLAAVSFAAYLIGCLLEIRAHSIVHWFLLSEWRWSLYRKIIREPRLDRFDDPHVLRWTETLETSRGAADLEAFITPNESLRSVRRPHWGRRVSRSALIDLAIYIHRNGGRGAKLFSLMGRFGDELDQLSIRLQARNMDLYGSYDRASAEADFRVNVGFSASVLVSIIAAKSSFEVLLLIPFTWFLMMRGQEKARNANDVLIQAVVSGELESSVLSSALPQLQTSPPRTEEPGEEDYEV
ncbi:hypothetical protein [Streptomyces minutiscleroticus]|uniref:hypothetical protein n=1 Tax=Streptomyces minutiscleroticus TaxID=68238 RepID=UPI00167CC0A0|nr:hypothetical protein [Streptomyces minutiscleroticus]